MNTESLQQSVPPLSLLDANTLLTQLNQAKTIGDGKNLTIPTAD